MSNTTRDTAQNQKDIIADFTLEFMNSIDDATELAETNEEKLTNIFNASNSIPAISKVSTWLVIGLEALVNSIKDVIYRVSFPNLPVPTRNTSKDSFLLAFGLKIFATLNSVLIISIS